METVLQMLCLQIVIVSVKVKQVVQPNMCQCIDCTNGENELDKSPEWSSDDEIF